MFKLYFKPKICQNIFGWSQFKKLYPDILNDGIEVKLMNDLYYVIKDNVVVNDTQFFTQEEVKEYCILHEIS